MLKKRSQGRRGRCRVRGNARRAGVTRALQAQQLKVGAGEEREKEGEGERENVYIQQRADFVTDMFLPAKETHAVTAPEDDNVHLLNAADLSSLQRK